MTVDWFRKTTWSLDDERAFLSRLARSRSLFHKAQYLRIQALTLADTGDETLVRNSLRLLQRLFTEFPEPSQLASSHLQAAQCHEQLGELEQAVDHFRLALMAQTHYPNLDPGTALEFPWFIIVHQFAALYDEALNTLEAASIAFPVQLFKAAAVRAVVAESRLDYGTASRHARQALEAAALNESAFRFHRDVGLVGSAFKPMVERLSALANSQSE